MSQNYALIWKAVDLAGSQKKLAAILAVPPSNVNRWVTLKTPIPIKHAISIEKWSDGAINAAALLNTDGESLMSASEKQAMLNAKLIDDLIKKAKVNDVAINVYVGLDEKAYTEVVQ